MTVLLLRLAAPLQSWGDASRFARRLTRDEPTKSGIVGLIAAAQGRRRSDPVEDLVGLRLATRTEQPGRLERDFQTAELPATGVSKLSERFYLHDAVFLVGIEGEAELLRGVAAQLRDPVYPLYLGRRSCPPAGQLVIGLRDGTLEEVMASEPWSASPSVMRRERKPLPRLRATFDARDIEGVRRTVRDVPVSFDPVRREYGWRDIVETHIEVVNPHVSSSDRVGSGDPHDPFIELDAL